MQIRGSTDALELARAFEFGGDGHRVGRFALGVEGEDRLVHGLVRRTIEVDGADLLDHVGDRVLGQQHAAEHGLLGSKVLRGGLPTEVLGGGGSRSPGPAPCHRRRDRARGHPQQPRVSNLSQRSTHTPPRANGYDLNGVGPPGRPPRESPVSTSCSVCALSVSSYRVAPTKLATKRAETGPRPEPRH